MFSPWTLCSPLHCPNTFQLIHHMGRSLIECFCMVDKTPSSCFPVIIDCVKMRKVESINFRFGGRSTSFCSSASNKALSVLLRGSTLVNCRLCKLILMEEVHIFSSLLITLLKFDFYRLPTVLKTCRRCWRPFDLISTISVSVSFFIQTSDSHFSVKIL